MRPGDGVYKLIQRGKLPAIRRSERGLRVPRIVLDAYRRRLETGPASVPIIAGDETHEQLLLAFERETGTPPGEWTRSWRAGQIEDSAENMHFMIRALGLLLHEQESREASHTGSPPGAQRRSAA